MKHLLKFIILILVQFVWFASSASADERDTVLIMGYRDIAITQGYINLLQDIYEESLPGHVVKIAVVDGSKEFEDLEREINQVIKPGDRLTHLAILTHGMTEELTSTKAATHLDKMGGIYEDQVEPLSNSLAKKLRPHVAPDASVSLQSCSTMCGTEPSAQRRAKSLLQSLGVSDGQLYGARTSEFGHHPRSVSLRSAIPSLAIFVLAMAANQGIIPKFEAEGWQSIAFGSGMMVSVGYGLSIIIKKIAKFSAAFSVTGLIFRQRAGEIVETSPVNKLLDFEQTLGLRSDTNARCSFLEAMRRYL